MSYMSEKTVNDFLYFYHLTRKEPSIKYLTEIYTAYFHIPYENLTKIIKFNTVSDERKRLRMPDELIQDHLRMRLGGTCYSLAFTLHQLLSHLGFETYLVTADTYGKVDNHAAVVVIAEGTKFLVDSGFTIPNVIEIAEDRTTYGHNPLGRFQLEYKGYGRLFQLSTRNRRMEKFRFMLKDVPIAEENYIEMWIQSFYSASLDTINIVNVIKDRLIRCRNEILTEYTANGKLQKSIAHNYAQLIEEIFGFPTYITHEAYTLLKEKAELKPAELIG